jgi:formylglycine-generating enzyme required for sulfatase activity
MKLQVERSWRSPGFAQTDRHPVVCVNWDDAKAYVVWLASTTGKNYRLLSEAEREYVTRAGTTTPFWWGSTITTDRANYNPTAGVVYKGAESQGEYRQRTVTVDSFEPNPWGLYNVHGNVFEWTEDCWNETYEGTPADGSARITGQCNYRVRKGGDWGSADSILRADGHFRDLAGDRRYGNGFRVARTLN